LIRVGAIRYPLIGWRLRLAENVFGGHRSLPAQASGMPEGMLIRIVLAPRLLALLQLQLALILFDENFKIGDSVEQLRPLFIVERHRKTAESIHADAAFLAHTELYHPASLFRFHLLL